MSWDLMVLTMGSCDYCHGALRIPHYYDEDSDTSVCSTGCAQGWDQQVAERAEELRHT